MGMALNNTNLILSFGQTYQNANASYNRIKELYEIQLQENGTVTVSEVHLINAEEISYIFENGRGLEKMSASFQKGKKYLISGPNGAGKTTLINILIRQYISLSGRLSINGINIKRLILSKCDGSAFPL